VLERFKRAEFLSFDTETTGLNTFLGSRPFCATLSDGEETAYLDLKNETEYKMFKSFLAERPRTWFGHNIKFDLHHIHAAGISFHEDSQFHDTMILARLVHSILPGGYSLDNCAKYFLGERKLDIVKAYIDEHKLYSYIERAEKREKVLHFDQVPRSILEPYARQDSLITYRLAERLLRELKLRFERHPNRGCGNVLRNESELIKTLWKMEQTGVRMDRAYVEEALAYEQERYEEAKRLYEEETGEVYCASEKSFTKAFANLGIGTEGFERTDKGNVKFDHKSLSKIEHIAGTHALTVKDAKSRINFYNGFLYYGDSEDLLHTNFHQGGTTTGRLSSSSPNLQNLTRPDEDAEQEAYPIRRAIVPHSPDYCLVMIDYNQQEYRLMLDYAGEMGLIEKILEGHDVHQAAADMAGITRTRAKTLNFATIYGAGKAKISEMLGLTLQEAEELLYTYFSNLPRIQGFINEVKNAAKQRGFLFNWYGRMLQYPDRSQSYVGPNHLIQGGCGDIIRVAKNRIALLLKDKKSLLSLSVHDELIFNMHKDELHLVPEIQQIMETVYPFKHLPLTTTASHSWVSLADKVKGLPSLQVEVPKRPARRARDSQVLGL
jgi:DNA polymerase I